MKITDFETFVVKNPVRDLGGRYFIFLKLVTNNGIVGYGEIYTDSFGPFAVEAMVADVFARFVDGHNPFQAELLFRRIYSQGFTQRPDVSISGVLSGIEMACWDIVGKALNQPVYNLLGGMAHDKIRTYTYLYGHPEDARSVYEDADIAAKRAVEYVEEGFTAVKFDPAGPYTIYGGHQPRLQDLELSDEFCRKIREAVGNKADLLFGTHGQFTTSGAIRMMETIAPYSPLWFEEPVPPDNVAQMAQVARLSKVPIATGERLTTKAEFGALLQQGAASILQMNLGRVGGILEAKKIAGMAEAFNAQIAPHLYCGPIVGAANIQIATCSPNFLILESIRKFDGFYGELIHNMIEWQNGYVIPPTKPGLGVNLNEDLAREHALSKDDAVELHLNMRNSVLLPD